jgi:hypothetical protein
MLNLGELLPPPELQSRGSLLPEVMVSGAGFGFAFGPSHQ